MRILHIAAGAGGMYCGACARDVVLIMGLRARGHDVHVVPLYTPLRVESDEPFPIAPVFWGGINLYLQQRSALFRRIPPALDRVLDNTSLLRLVSRFAVSTRASELGEMAVAVLAGAEGPFLKESQRLLAYLDQHPAPDVVVITNTMLSGLAPTLKERLGASIVCQVQGEDGFVGGMPEPHRSQAHGLIRDNARHVDVFVSPNERYAGEMAGYVDIPQSRMRVVRTGVPAGDYAAPGPRHRDPFTIGYLSGIAHGKGLDLLVEACRKLVEDEGRDMRLRVAGGVLDKGYWEEARRSVERGGLVGRFDYAGEIDFATKARFLHGCSVFCVPSRIAEVRGLAVMEAMAAGVPVVAPDAGVYPELLTLAGGGHLARVEDVDHLASKLAHLIDHADEADRLGRAGAQGVARHYSPEQSVDGMAAVLEEAVAR